MENLIVSPGQCGTMRFAFAGGPLMTSTLQRAGWAIDDLHNSRSEVLDACAQFLALKVKAICMRAKLFRAPVDNPSLYIQARCTMAALWAQVSFSFRFKIEN
jgi:hypothetical protein